MRFRFIEENTGTLPLSRLCQIMDVSARGYRAYKSRTISQRQRNDMVLLAHIREQFSKSLRSYGRPRMTEELKELGFKVGHRRVGRVDSGKMVYLLSEPENIRCRPTAITSSTLRQIY